MLIASKKKLTLTWKHYLANIAHKIQHTGQILILVSKSLLLVILMLLKLNLYKMKTIRSRLYDNKFKQQARMARLSYVLKKSLILVSIKTMQQNIVCNAHNKPHSLYWLMMLVEFAIIITQKTNPALQNLTVIQTSQTSFGSPQVEMQTKLLMKVWHKEKSTKPQNVQLSTTVKLGIVLNAQ